MATVLKTQDNHGVNDALECVFYIDSINKESYIAEMYNYCVRYIREKTDISNSEPMIFKREKFMASTETEIRNEKEDGFWIIGDEKNRIVTLYKRLTYAGRFYDSIYVNKVFTLTCQECSKIVPQVFKKSSLYEDFTEELTARVTTFKNRTDTTKHQ